MNPRIFTHLINPLSHLMQDSYFKPEIEAVLGFFWPLPQSEDITELRTFVRARVNYIMSRQAVSHRSMIVSERL